MTDIHTNLKTAGENYGDVNPIRYGGLFIKWDRDMWQVVESFPHDEDADSYVFHVDYVEDFDVFRGGERRNGFTDGMKKTLESFSSLAFNMDMCTADDPHIRARSIDHAVIDCPKGVLAGIAYMVSDRQMSRCHRRTASDYWGFLGSEDFDVARIRDE